MDLIKDISSAVGKTAIVELNSTASGGRIFAKCEFMNPAGSIKDRAAREMLDDAERRGLIQPGAMVVEPTSGNTGIGLAAIGVPRGYRVVLTMPETMSVERRTTLKAYGAELVLTEGAKGMSGAIQKAQEIVASHPGSFMPGQFDNPANPAAHEATTGPEIWAEMGGNVDIFVAGVGTGGTITGVGRYLRRMNPEVYIVAVEPAASPVLSGGKAGPHKIQGIGAGFVPSVLDTSIYNEVMPVRDEDAFAAGRALAGSDGLMTGISGGAAVWAARQLAARPENSRKNIVVVLPDTGARYLSTPLFDD